jgi:beta-glucosidase
MPKRPVHVVVILELVILFVALATSGAQTAQPSSAPLYLEPSQSLDVRVNDLVSRMTLEEKASQLVNQSRAIPRLMVPQYDWRNEALHGVVGVRIATVFPEPIGLAATFDASLIHELGTAIGTEGRAKYNKAVREGRRDILEGLDFWAPNINIARDPRWGRGQETYGEDPFLTGRMAVAFVTGLQGDDPYYMRVVATPKHFAVHSGPEPSRHTRNVAVSNHDLQDTYLPAFRDAVVEGKAGSVMCSYNRVNDEPACANTFLLRTMLRNAWKFDGYVVGDCDSVEEIFSEHHYVKSIPEAAALSLKRGTDNECIDSYTEVLDNSDYVRYLEAVKLGLLTEKEIDVSVKRLLTARFRLGLFDPPAMVRYAATPDLEIDSEVHRGLALRAARESMVLLKNNGVLPLAPDIKKIAVVGPPAESARVLLGNYYGTPSRVTTALDGIRKSFPDAQITYAPGMNFLREESLVPATVFSTQDGRPGLTGEYFTNKELRGEPSLVRVDRCVNMESPPLTQNSLEQPPGPNEFSIRWSGFLSPVDTGSYQLRPTASANRLWLDGKLIIDNWIPNSDEPKTAIVTLEKGRRYAFKLEAVSRDDGGATLVWLALLPNPLPQALSIAQSADVVIAVVGLTSQLEGEELKVSLPGFKGGDRTSLDLPEVEEQFLKALKDTGKPLVVVLTNGSALSINWANEHADAILDSWYAGEEGGAAIGETLAGRNNPAGRLPITFYKSVDQLPPFDDYSMKNRTYRYFTGAPLYPFGYGLSYSKFTYGNLKLSKERLSAGEALMIETDVTNDSALEGDEVVELYLSFPQISGAPIHALRGFMRVHLSSRKTQHIHFELNSRDLSLVNETGDRIVVPGAYIVSVGGAQPALGIPTVKAQFTIIGAQKLTE